MSKIHVHVTVSPVALSFKFWTNLAALPLGFRGMLAWILAGTCEAFAVLYAILTGTQDALQDLPQDRMPHVTMRVGVAAVLTCLLVVFLQQEIHGGLCSTFEVEFGQAQASGSTPDCRWSRTDSAPLELLSSTLVQ